MFLVLSVSFQWKAMIWVLKCAHVCFCTEKDNQNPKWPVPLDWCYVCSIHTNTGQQVVGCCVVYASRCWIWHAVYMPSSLGSMQECLVLDIRPFWLLVTVYFVFYHSASWVGTDWWHSLLILSGESVTLAFTILLERYCSLLILNLCVTTIISCSHYSWNQRDFRKWCWYP